ncbi:MAG: hypothetical protein JWO38_4041 [Gemmataceae bacterium]|nr:hypothetical protein [Gemmataceae bacterium]
MPIPYRFLDFAPRVKEQALSYRLVETVQETVLRANEWIVQSGVRVINLETLMLPIGRGEDEGTSTGRNDFSGEGPLVQVIRVWYVEPR